MSKIMCPNKSDPMWVALNQRFGKNATWALYLENNNNIPTSLNEVASLIGKGKQANRLEKDSRYIDNVNEAIKEQLTNMGVGIGTLTRWEKANGINGVFDPSVKKQEGQHLVDLIRLDTSLEGKIALPEEYAHLVDAILEDSNPKLMERLTEILKDENVLEEVLEREEIGSYQKYQNLYKNNQAQLIAEGRAKLIGRHILKNEQARYNNNIINKALNWLKNAFNTIFKKANPDTLQYKLNAADVEASKFAVKVMNGEVELSIDFDSMNNKHIMYNAAKDVSNKKETLKKILFTETKRKNILEKSKKLNLEEQEHLKKLGSNLDTYNRMLMMEREDEGILGFLEDAYKEMQEVMNDTEGLKIDKNMHNLSIQRAAKYLRKLKNFVDAYESISKEMFNYTESNEYKENVAKGQYVDITVNMQQFTYLLKQAERQYEKMSKPLFFEFIKPFAAPLMGQQIKGNKVDEAFLENMLTEAKQDIGFMDRWIVSMAQSSDLMLRLIEQPIKHINQQIRGKVIKKLQILQKAQEDLEKAGYSDTSFVYERDGSGHLTGRYVQEIDWARYGKEKNDFYEKLNKKYDKSKDSTWYKESNKWLEEHADFDRDTNTRTPKKHLYTSNAFKQMNPKQLDFYKVIIDTKTELDALLPNVGVDKYLLPQVRKDLLERLKDAKGFKNGVKLLASGFKDAWVTREADDEFGALNSLRNYDGTKLNTIPLHYTKALTEMEMLSTDIVSTMTLYANMAYTYEGMNEVLDIMEIGKDLMRNRIIPETKSGKPLVEKIKRTGSVLENKVVKRQGDSKFMDKLDDFYEAQIYGIKQKDEGTLFGSNISIAKAANNANVATSLSSYAINVLAATANISVGKVMRRVEAISGRYFNYKNLVFADKTYFANMPDIIAEVGHRRVKSKFGLFIQKFNAMQDFEKMIRGVEMNRKNVISKMFKMETLFLMNNAGEHYLQTTTLLALADNYKLKDSSGKLVNLWDAYEVALDENGIENLRIKEGITKVDGTKFTERDVERLTRKSAAINQDLHGIYNREDMNAFQKTAIGRLAMMFRKWLPSAMTRRFQGENYSLELEDNKEGYYNTTGKFLWNVGKDLMKGKIAWATHWNTMEEFQKRNIYRALAELTNFMVIAMAYSILNSKWKDDDKDYWQYFLLYQLRRLQTEVGVMTPTPYVLDEGMKIIQSPAAAVNWADNLLGILNFWDLGSTVQSGTYEGWNAYARDLIRPLPFHNQIRKGIHPEQALKFYQ